jgi:hypothetical protein
MHSLRVPAVILFAALAGAAPATAQFGPDPATGERYVVEIAGGFWKPTPDLVISAETLGIPGTEIDFVTDLGIEKKWMGDLRFVLRPGRKHKFRVGFNPIRYEADTVLQRTLVFQGATFPVRLPVQSSVQWNAWRFGYEWDFVYRDRGFVGVILEAKYTELEAELRSPIRNESAKARAPIPAIGGIARGYIVPNISVTGELTAFKLPGSISERDDAAGRYLDFDVYGTVNFVNSAGVQVGYRSLDLSYVVDLDFGDLKMRGPYLLGVVRF